jgi:hypothetical protein
VSYHLSGIAQQWYITLERDAGEPDWDEFKLLCHQRFGPPISTNHLADLACLPFNSTVEAYLETFQAPLVHTGCLAPLQQAQLFTGGLPEALRVDVELHEPQDLQRAMRLARAYEHRNVHNLLALPVPPPRSPHRVPGAQVALPASGASQGASSSASPAAPPRTFKRLSPDEMAAYRKQGLCYNCDDHMFVATSARDSSTSRRPTISSRSRTTTLTCPRPPRSRPRSRPSSTRMTR